jgi:SRSO17 transposase
MVTAVTNEEVAGWAAGLDEVGGRIAGRFVRPASRRQAVAYLRGLLGPVERKNGWQLAEHAGDPTPDRMQWLLGRARWDADAVRDDLRAYALGHLADPAAVVVGDETGVPKKGEKSAGVQRQYCGRLGKVDNCQVGVLLAYAGPRGAAFVDRELYLPAAWAADAGRRAEAGVPTAVEFRTKPELLRAMLARLLAAGAPIPWVTADEEYGSAPALRDWLAAERIPAVLGVRANETVRAPRVVPLVSWARGQPPGPPIATAVISDQTAREVAATIAADGWHTISAGDGAQGPRLYQWASVPLTEPAPDGWAQWLLVRRGPGEPTELAYYRVCAPAVCPLAEQVRVAGTRWRIEDALGEAKGAAGLDHYEVRRWDGWYRHVTLALLAHAFLVVTRARRPHPADGARGAPPPGPPDLAQPDRSAPRPALVHLAPSPSGARPRLPPSSPRPTLRRTTTVGLMPRPAEL